MSERLTADDIRQQSIDALAQGEAEREYAERTAHDRIAAEGHDPRIPHPGATSSPDPNFFPDRDAAYPGWEGPVRPFVHAGDKLHSPPFVRVDEINVMENLDAIESNPINTVIVDNYSNAWLYVRGVERYVGPFVIGTTMPLRSSSSKRQVVWTAPGGQSQPGSPSGIATVTWCEERMEPSAGEQITP